MIFGTKGLETYYSNRYRHVLEADLDFNTDNFEVFTKVIIKIAALKYNIHINMRQKRLIIIVLK